MPEDEQNGIGGGSTQTAAAMLNATVGIPAEDVELQGRVSLALHKVHSVCLVLDYGSQYTQLIARRIRENGVYSMLLPGDVTMVKPQAMPLNAR
jgi:hypothetical protein